MSSFALLLARDVTGLTELAQALLVEHGFDLYGLESVDLEAAGMQVVTIDEARAMIEASGDRNGIVVANYFDVETVGRGFMSWKKAMAAFDCGIVNLVRAAAFKPDRLAVIGNPAEYPQIMDILRSSGGTFSQRFRMEQACNALHAASAFDAAVAQYLEIQGGDVPDLDALGGYPKSIRFAWKRSMALASGENEHQKAALYGTFGDHVEQLHGPALDYGAVVDVSAAIYLIGDFEKATIALVQKGGVLAVSSGQNQIEAWEGLGDADLRNFRRGACVVNFSVNAEFATRLAELSAGSIVAPRFSDESREVLQKRDSLNLLVSRESIGYEALLEVRSVVGGALVQDKNRASVNPMEWGVRSFAQPRVGQWEDMIFAVKVGRHLNSSACIAVQGERILALSQGQLVQEQAVREVLRQLEEVDTALVVLAFDETLESPDIIEQAKASGVSVLVHPGSLDPASHPELAEMANEVGAALVATGRSHRKL